MHYEIRSKNALLHDGFTSGTCSLQALSNCLAGDTDLHWVQIYNSEKSPYHSPLGLLFQAAPPRAADGV